MFLLWKCPYCPPCPLPPAVDARDFPKEPLDSLQVSSHFHFRKNTKQGRCHCRRLLFWTKKPPVEWRKLNESPDGASAAATSLHGWIDREDVTEVDGYGESEEKKRISFFFQSRRCPLVFLSFRLSVRPSICPSVSPIVHPSCPSQDGIF